MRRFPRTLYLVTVTKKKQIDVLTLDCMHITESFFPFYLCLDISLSTTIQESFGAIRTVRSFAQESHEISRYGGKVEETLKLGLKQAVSALPFM